MAIFPLLFFTDEGRNSLQWAQHRISLNCFTNWRRGPRFQHTAARIVENAANFFLAVSPSHLAKKAKNSILSYPAPFSPPPLVSPAGPRHRLRGNELQLLPRTITRGKLFKTVAAKPPHPHPHPPPASPAYNHIKLFFFCRTSVSQSPTVSLSQNAHLPPLPSTLLFFKCTSVFFARPTSPIIPSDNSPFQLKTLAIGRVSRRVISETVTHLSLIRRCLTLY